MTQAVRLEEDTSLEDGTSVAPELDGTDGKWNQASISRSTEDRTHQPELEPPSTDILASLVEPGRDESRIKSTPTLSSSEIEQERDPQAEEIIKEYEPTSSLSESNEGLLSSFFTKARNALAAIIPEPIKEVARSIDRKLSEVLPVWNDIKAWASDAFESICDFFDDLLSDEGTEATTKNSSSQSGAHSKTNVPKGDFNQSEFASLKNRGEQAQSKQDLRKALEDGYQDVLKDRKEKEEALLKEVLEEAMMRMLEAKVNEPTREEAEQILKAVRENNFTVDTFDEKQDMIRKVASEISDSELNSLMNTVLREQLIDKNFRTLEPFGFTEEEAKNLIETAKRIIEKSVE